MIIFRSYPIAKTGCCCYWCRFGRMVFVALCDDISLCACQKRVFIEARTMMMMAYMRKSTTCARRLLQSGFDPPHNRTNTNKNACTYKLKVRIQFAPHPIGILFVFFFFILNIFCCVAVVANEMKQNNRWWCKVLKMFDKPFLAHNNTTTTSTWANLRILRI